MMGEVVSLTVARERRGPRVEPRVSKAEIAAHFGVSVRTITRWMDRGMPFDKPFEGGVPRFVVRECEAWFCRRG